MVDLSAQSSSPLVTTAEAAQVARLPTLSTQHAGALFFIAVGIFFAGFGLEYRVGSLRSMGPGMFPVAGGVALMGLGTLLLLRSLRDTGEVPSFALRTLGAVIGAVLAFALTVDHFGLAVAAPLLIAGAVIATGQGTIRLAIGLSATLTIFAIVVFPVLLGVPLKVLP